MLCTSSETVAFDCENIADALDTMDISEFSAAYTMLREHGLKIQKALDEKNLSHAMLEGSAFCAAVSMDVNERPVRGLLSPEELSINMAMMVLNHG
jgi:hypothetical protein